MTLEAKRKAKPKAKPTNTWVGLLFNIILPVLCLTKLGEYQQFSAHQVVIIALSFPLIYSIFEYNKFKKLDLLSVISFISVLLVGGISLLQLPPEYIAYKEAAIPLVIGISCVISLRTKYPLVKVLLFNDKIFNTELIRSKVKQLGNHQQLSLVLKTATWLLASSFFLSAILNYFLAIIIVNAPAGTELYNQQLGKMMALSLPVIALPCTIIMFITMVYFFKKLSKLTDSKIEELLIINK